MSDCEEVAKPLDKVVVERIVSIVELLAVNENSTEIGALADGSATDVNCVRSIPELEVASMLLK